MKRLATLRWYNLRHVKSMPSHIQLWYENCSSCLRNHRRGIAHRSLISHDMPIWESGPHKDQPSWVICICYQWLKVGANNNDKWQMTNVSKWGQFCAGLRQINGYQLEQAEGSRGRETYHRQRRRPQRGGKWGGRPASSLFQQPSSNRLSRRIPVHFIHHSTCTLRFTAFNYTIASNKYGYSLILY